MATPTYSETYNSLAKISAICARGIRASGKIEGQNCLGSEEELRQLVLALSKDILNAMPCLQLENDEIEEMDSRYGSLLSHIRNPEDYE
jgi:hypothetical protein